MEDGPTGAFQSRNSIISGLEKCCRVYNSLAGFGAFVVFVAAMAASIAFLVIVFVSVLPFYAGCASIRCGRRAGRQLHPKEKDRGGAVMFGCFFSTSVQEQSL